MDPEAVCGGPKSRRLRFNASYSPLHPCSSYHRIAKVLLKFLRERYTGSGFYHAGDSTSAEAPSEVLEERLADAAEIVVAQQIGSENGNELLAPGDTRLENQRVAMENVR